MGGATPVHGFEFGLCEQELLRNAASALLEVAYV